METGFIATNRKEGRMMNPKQRAYLKRLASTMNAIYQVGKGGVTPEIVCGIAEALEARELIKISVLKNCEEDPKTLSVILAERTRSQVVQVIGRKIVLYRASKNNPKIVLP